MKTYSGVHEIERYSMSFEEILIHRVVPCINGYLKVPDKDQSVVTLIAGANAISGSSIERLSVGSGAPRGSKCGQQEYLLLPGIRPDAWYAVDPITLID